MIIPNAARNENWKLISLIEFGFRISIIKADMNNAFIEFLFLSK